METKIESANTSVQVVEIAGDLQEGPPLACTTIDLGDGVTPSQLRAGSDGRLWVVANGVVIAVKIGGGTTRYGVPGDAIEALGFAQDGSLVLRLRKAKALQRMDTQGKLLGTPYPLPKGMEGIYFTPGPSGETWLPSLNKAMALAIPQTGTPRKIYCHSSTGMARDAQHLMWGIEGGLFAVDSVGEERARVYFNVNKESPPYFADDGALHFLDLDEADHPRVNRFEGPTTLTRRTLPPEYNLLSLIPSSDARMWISGTRGNEGIIARTNGLAAITVHPLAGGPRVPSDTALGSDNRLWLIGDFDSRLFAVTP